MAESSSNGEQQQQRTKSPRPESTMALDFSQALDGAFGLTPELQNLNSNVEQKKQAVTTQNQELAELEARLKAAENRLKRAGLGSSSQTTGGSREDENGTENAPRPPAKDPPPPPTSQVARSAAAAATQGSERSSAHRASGNLRE